MMSCGVFQKVLPTIWTFHRANDNAGIRLLSHALCSVLLQVLSEQLYGAADGFFPNLTVTSY